MDEDSYGNFEKDKCYSLEMSSEHMTSRVVNKPYSATYNSLGEAQADENKSMAKEKYEVTLKKEVFVKFF